MLSRFWDAKTAQILSTVIIFLLAIAFLRGAKGTITLFLFAVLFSYLVEPLVSWLQKLLRGRIRAIAAFYLLAAGLFTALGFLFGGRMVHEARSLVASVPDLVNRMASGQFIVALGRSQGWQWQREVQIQHFFMAHRNFIIDHAEKFAESLEAPLTRIWWLILIPILGFFFLKDAPSILRGLVDLGAERKERSTIRNIAQDVHVMLGSYIRAQTILAALTAVALTIVLGLMRAPYSFILSPLAGLGEFIPVVGPAVACVVIFGVAALAGYNHLLWIFLFLGTWRVIQDYINAPRIMGKSLEISPLLEIFGVLAGGEIGGVVGALVAVPIIAILHILGKRLSGAKPAAAKPAAAKPAV